MTHQTKVLAFPTDDPALKKAVVENVREAERNERHRAHTEKMEDALLGRMRAELLTNNGGGDR